MKILLLKKDRLNTFELPNKVSGNVWITNNDENGNSKNMINIEATSTGEWQLKSNDQYYVIVDSKKVASVILKQYAFYMIKENSSDNVLFIYCSKTYDNMTYYSASTELITGILIGSDVNSKIRYNCKYVNKTHAQLVLTGERIVLTDLKSNYGVYVKNAKINGSVYLEYGEVAFILGLRILVLKINGTYVIGINNPDNLVTTTLKEFNINQDKNNEIFDEPQEEKDLFVYAPDDYFHKKPRIIYTTEEKNIVVDSPPSSQINQKMPLIMTVGPMMTMSLTSGVMMYSTINDILIGEKTWEDSITSLVTSGVMMISFLVWPLITNLFQRNMEKGNEKKRQKKYSEYIEYKKKEITKEKEDQERILRKKYPTLKQCEEIILKKDDRLWERRIEDNDFFHVSLGIGSFPMKLSLKIPEEHFTVDDDRLRLKLKELSSTDKNLVDVPFEYSFIENYISAIVGKSELRYRLIKNILLQLITFHSYDNLKIAIFTTKDKEDFWKDFAILPHCWNNDKTIRFFGTSPDEYKELSYNLERILSSRSEEKENNGNENEVYNPTFLIVTDSFSAVRNIEFINNVIEEKEYLGFSMLILTEKIATLPNQCQTFIELDDTISKVVKNVENNEKNSFRIDKDIINYYECYKTLANIPIEITDNFEGAIPKKVGFLEMYDIGKVEQFNSLARWKKNVPVSNMGAIVGIGKSGEKISLDLHEKFHGPHGLVAGMTGSGKSEFIITYILSMAVNYHPEEVQFILIDYKGGGLAGAFENRSIGYKLPHLVGVITNLDKTEINRSLASIESELKRRQSLFNKAREISGESTVDIYKYQKMYRNKVVSEPVSHLFIIADEFAELKTQQPEFMEQLISTARIGRSLGVHLILATQKPSGVVDAQIWSNTRFRVCLRVQEKSDSAEVIKCPDAAFLTQTGRFYLQVGYNEIFELGQSAWAGGKYIPSESIKKTIDSSINFVNNTGYIIKTTETKEEVMTLREENKGEELNNIVQYLANCALEENIKTRPLWLEKIPAFIKIEDLIKKYNYEKEKFSLNPVIGEYDVPDKQEQHLLTLPFNSHGNTIVYGAAGTGKENFITTMIYSSMLTYTPEEVNYYILDFGAEILRYFDNSPIVGDIIYLDQDEKLKNLFRKVNKTISERKSLFADYNGDYNTYCKNSNNPLPAIVVVINNFEAYSETYIDDIDSLIEITRDCIKYGIYFLITSNTPESVRFKLKQNFGNLFSLQQNSEEDYTTIFGNVHKTYPSKIFGRGIMKKDNIYEFQTAYVSDVENISTIVKAMSEKLSSIYKEKAPKIPVLPETVIYDDIKDESKENEIIIGIEKSSLDIYKLDFTKFHIYNISSVDFSLFDYFVNPFILQYKYKNNIQPIIINAEDFILDDEVKNSFECADSDFDVVFEKISNYLEESENKFKDNNFNKSIFNNTKQITCIIIGINSFKNKLNSDNQAKFDDFFSKCSDLEIINFILIDTVDKLKNFQYDSWFKSHVTSNEGIWIGSGLSEQFVINVTKRTPEMQQDIDGNFCFGVRRGKPTLIKYIEQINK